MQAEVLAMVDELEELSYNRGLLRARLEIALQLTDEMPQEVPTAKELGGPGGPDLPASDTSSPPEPHTKGRGEFIRTTVLGLVPLDGMRKADEIWRATTATCPCSPVQVRIALSDLVKTGALRRISQGQYQRIADGPISLVRSA